MKTKLFAAMLVASFLMTLTRVADSSEVDVPKVEKINSIHYVTPTPRRPTIEASNTAQR